MSDWLTEWEENLCRHTKALPKSSRWERAYFRVFGVNPQSVVDRRMEALMLDELENKRWVRDNPPPWSKS